MAGVGVAGMQWRGEWADDVDYELGDLVSFDGNVYVTTGDQTVVATYALDHPNPAVCTAAARLSP